MRNHLLILFFVGSAFALECYIGFRSKNQIHQVHCNETADFCVLWFSGGDVDAFCDDGKDFCAESGCTNVPDSYTQCCCNTNYCNVVPDKQSTTIPITTTHSSGSNLYVKSSYLQTFFMLLFASLLIKRLF